MHKLPDSVNKFTMLNVDDNRATDEDLIEYAKNFKQWCYELRFNKICSYRYNECYSDYTAVTRIFNRYCDYKEHDQISPTEYKWFEKTANFGLQYLKQDDYTKQSYAYDFKNQYALILNSDNKIPTKTGKECKLKELPKRKDLKPGFYHVKINCDNDNFRKIFAFSKHNVYLKESLYIAMKHRKKFNVNIELIIKEDEFNTYLYDDKDMVTLNSITGEWFTKLTDLRKVYPQNRLIKHLLSSVWGHLNASNIKYINSVEEMQKLDIGVDMDSEYMIVAYNEYAKEKYWEIMVTAKPYKYNIRLKPWITANARNLTAGIVLQDIKNVIRVQTDCIVFNKEIIFDNPNLISEEKTTGKVHWRNVNCYKNITTGYQSKNYKD
jgi:hypothetical protein